MIVCEIVLDKSTFYEKYSILVIKNKKYFIFNKITMTYNNVELHFENSSYEFDNYYLSIKQHGINRRKYKVIKNNKISVLLNGKFSKSMDILGKIGKRKSHCKYSDDNYNRFLKHLRKQRKENKKLKRCN